MNLPDVTKNHIWAVSDQLGAENYIENRPSDENYKNTHYEHCY